MQKLNYIRCDDYYIPDIRLPEETKCFFTKQRTRDPWGIVFAMQFDRWQIGMGYAIWRMELHQK